MSDDLVTKVKMALESDSTPRVFHIRSVDALALVSCIKALTAERDRLRASNMQMLGDIAVAMGRIDALIAERDLLRRGIEYVLDGYGLAGPDYRFPEGEVEANWITDHLVSVMKGETP